MRLGEILTADAHIAQHGAKSECFDTAEDSMSANIDFLVQVDGKSIGDRYERLERPSDMKGKGDAVMSVVGVEVLEVDELLIQCPEARREQATQ